MEYCMHLLRVESLFPPVLWSSCTHALLAFNTRCFGRLFLLIPDPWAGEPNVGFVTLTPVTEPLDIVIFQSVGHPLGWCRIAYIKKVSLLQFDVASSLSLGIGFFLSVSSLFS